MSHGKKKWIKDVTGRWKKSSDRTKKDKYARVKYWHEYEPHSRGRYWRGRGRQGEFCPQCKHNFKPLLAHNRAVNKAEEIVKQEWKDLYWDDVVRFFRKMGLDITTKTEWEINNHLRGEYWHRNDLDRPISVWKYLSENRDRIGLRYYNFTDYLCPKHKNWDRWSREEWMQHPHGFKENWQWMARHDYQKYRARVKNVLRKNWEDYDEMNDAIPDFKREWYD